MKIALALGAIFLAITGANPRQQQNFGLPELNVIKKVTLGPSYGCRSQEDIRKGYEQTALFLSKYSHSYDPELLFNGACESGNWFENSLAGDQMGLIADLGEVPLERVTAQSAFNIKNVNRFEFYSKFTRIAKIELNHTYVALSSGPRVRTLFVFTVVGYTPDKKVDLEYAVKEYQLLNVEMESPGFNWTMPNE